MAMLLGTRSKGRSRSSQRGFGARIGATVTSLVQQVTGRPKSQRSLLGGGGSSSVSMWIFGGGLLLAFVVGFVAGGSFGGGSTDDGTNGVLRANGRQPSFIGEHMDTRALSPTAFIVAAYAGLDAEQALAQASALTGTLQDLGLGQARPYHWPVANGKIWVQAVYFNGEEEKAQTKALLLQVADQVEDGYFRQLLGSPDWPVEYQVRVQ
ncbi:MAG: hypothetical protein AB8H80_19490 [Planctomycetota bacterium]